MRALLICCVVTSLLASSASAAAKPPGADAAECKDRPKAKRLFDAAHLAYRRGEYEEAILKFQDSYALCKQPLTLLAIGNAYERLGDLEAALEHLKKYRPDAEPRERDEIDNRIATIGSRVEEQKDKEREEKAAAERKAKDDEARRNAAKDPPPEPPSGQTGEAGPLRWAGWSTGAVGAATLVASVVTGALALSLDGDLADGCVDGICPADRGADVDRLQKLSTATDVLLVLGATLTAGGIVMWILDLPGDSSTSVGLSLGPGLSGVSLRRSF